MRHDIRILTFGGPSFHVPITERAAGKSTNCCHSFRPLSRVPCHTVSSGPRLQRVSERLAVLASSCRPCIRGNRPSEDSPRRFLRSAGVALSRSVCGGSRWGPPSFRGPGGTDTTQYATAFCSGVTTHGHLHETCDVCVV